MFSGHGYGVALWRIGPRQQVIDLGVGVAVDDYGEHGGEIAKRFDAIEFCCLCRPANYAECLF